MRFGFVVWGFFFTAMSNFTWERPHSRPAPDGVLGAGSFTSCELLHCWGFLQTQTGRYHTTATPASSGYAGMLVSAQQHDEPGQKLTW